MSRVEVRRLTDDSAGIGGGINSLPTTISVSPSSFNIAPDETEQLTATVENGSGDTAWESSNTNVATVSSSGLVTGVAEGSVTITATNNGVSDTSSGTVAEASALHPNEPNGMTVLIDNDGTVAESGGDAFGSPLFGAWSRDASDFGDIVVVDDATNPSGSGQSIEFRWDAGIDEAGVARAGNLGGPWDELYFSFAMYWVGGGSWDSQASPKIFYFGPSATDNWISRNTSGTIGVHPQGGLESPVSSGAGGCPTDEWVQIELHVVAQTTLGNGEAYLYINGELIDSSTAAEWFGGNSPFNGMEWYAHVNELSVDSIYRVGYLRVCGRNN